jgi:hypothetical protein
MTHHHKMGVSEFRFQSHGPFRFSSSDWSFFTVATFRPDGNIVVERRCTNKHIAHANEVADAVS